MTAAFADYLLPQGLGHLGAEERLSAHLRLAPGGAESVERTYYDTFDGRLHAAGLELTEDGGGLAAANGVGEIARSPLPGRPFGSGMLATQLPPGALRDLVAPLVEMRALTQLVRIRSRQRSLRVLDDEAKTVVRLVLEDPGLSGPGARRRLGSRLHVRGVRGYEQLFARACRLLENDLGLERAAEPLLDEAVTAAGGTPAGVSSKLTVAFRGDERADVAAATLLLHLAGTIEQNLPGVLDDVDSEFLHDLRVAVRRTRSAQRELLPVFPPEPIALFRDEFRWLQRVTGPTRDLDVYLWQFDDLGGALPESRRIELEPLRRLLRRRRAAARRKLLRALRSVRFRALRSEWPAFLEQIEASPGDARPAAAQPIAELAGERVGAVYRRMVKAGGAIDDDTPAEALHDLRKLGKELRYLLEFFASLYPADLTPMASALRGLQDTLGRFYDREIQAESLRSLGRDVAALAEGPETLMTMGLLVEQLEADQAAARSEFTGRFAAFASKHQREFMRATFA